MSSNSPQQQVPASQQQQQQQPSGGNNNAASSSSNANDRRINVTRSRGLPRGPLQLLVSPMSIKNGVKKPPGVNLNHWLSTHTVDFYQLTTVLFGTLANSSCTAETCACMNCGSTFEYLWRDPGARPVRLSAPEYVLRLSQWITEQMNDEAKFPTTGNYPEDFQVHVKNIFRRLFRVYAHAYTSHYDSICDLGVNTSFNTAFIHFMVFASEFDLISVMELKPAKDLLFAVCPEIAEDKFRSANNAASAET